MSEIKMKAKIKVVAFDADDTLWVNEPYFRETEEQFCAMLESFLPIHSVAKELFRFEIKNLPLYGYGIKGFMLSMVETAIHVTGGTANISLITKILDLGKEMLEKPIELLDGVEETLSALKGKYRLVVATKGDLLDQERKLRKSGLIEYFHHIEIMSDKQVSDYQKLLKHLDCQPDELVMIGNSIKSDILPVLEIGSFAVHVPYHTTWEHEQVDHTLDHDKFFELTQLNEILKFLN